MIDFAEVSTALGTVVSIFTALGGVGIWQYKKQNKRLKNAEVLLSEVQVEKARMETKADDWHIWKEQNESLAELNKQLTDRNHELVDMLAEKENRHQEELKDKTEQIRKYVDDVMKAESEINRVNDLLHESKDRITELTEERDEERRKKEYYKRWRCEKSSCLDPEGRIPPNSKLLAEKYVHPE